MASRLSLSIREYVVLFSAAFCFCLVLALTNGLLVPVRQIDTASYESFPLLLSVASLEQTRTFVYPMFLKAAIAILGGDAMAWVPAMQLVVWLIAIGGWGVALHACRFPSVGVLTASLPLYGLPFAWRYTPVLTPDLLGCSFALLAASFWLVAVFHPADRWAFVLTGLFVFASYQTKPVYLFLVPWTPIATWAARGWLFSWGKAARLAFVRASLASVVPFLAWCTLRFVLVGHFGLVSFGGYNIVGITGQLLRAEHVPHLSKPSRELAERILVERSQRTDWDSSGAFDRVSQQFNPMVWEIAVPIASELEGGEAKKINASLSRFSREVLMVAPKEYCIWLLRAIKHATIELARSVGGNAVVWIATVVFAYWWCIDWLQMKQRAKPVNEARDREAKEWLFAARALERMREVQAIVWLAVGWSFGKMLLVILVEPPNERYAGPASLFLASALLSLIIPPTNRMLGAIRMDASVGDD